MLKLASLTGRIGSGSDAGWLMRVRAQYRVRRGRFQTGDSYRDCETCGGAGRSLGEVGSSASVFYIL